MDRTFAITATKEIVADGVQIKSGDRVAVITGMVPPLTLFGLMQFHNFAVEEIPVEVIIRDEADESAAVEAVSTPSTESIDATFNGESEAIDPPAISEAEAIERLSADAASRFVADGLDEKTARILAEQNDLDPDELRKLIAEGFDLIDLEGIGLERVKKILAVYPKN